MILGLNRLKTPEAVNSGVIQSTPSGPRHTQSLPLLFLLWSFELQSVSGCQKPVLVCALPQLSWTSFPAPVSRSGQFLNSISPFCFSHGYRLSARVFLLSWFHRFGVLPAAPRHMHAQEVPGSLFPACLTSLYPCPSNGLHMAHGICCQRTWVQCTNNDCGLHHVIILRLL